MQRILAMYVHGGFSTNAIAQQLTLERVPTQSDHRTRGPAHKLGTGTWQPSSVYLLLKHETYMGILYYGKTENSYPHTNSDKKTTHGVKPKEALNISVVWHPDNPLEIQGSIPFGIGHSTPGCAASLARH